MTKSKLITKSNKKSVSFRIDEKLYDRIANVRAEAANQGMQFDTTAIIAEALEKAVVSAQRELRIKKPEFDTDQMDLLSNAESV